MKKIITSVVFVLMFLPALRAQQEGAPPTPEEREKKLIEYIEEQVEKLSSQLSLEYWQEFYADSTLNYNLHSMQEELEKMQKSGVQNTDMYIAAQDRWNEKTYLAFKSFLTPEQWEKYLKGGALREKQARDKRAGIAPENKKKKKK